MKTTIQELYSFQEFYLLKVLKNIPEELLYSCKVKDLNSPGWIVGHLIIEVEDVAKHLGIDFTPSPFEWQKAFKGGSNFALKSTEKLPTKQMLIHHFTARYRVLLKEYLKLNDKTLNKAHPSPMFQNIYSNIDAWFTHHLITHVAVHIGNITSWKKVHGLEVEGL